MGALSHLETVVFNIIAGQQDYYDDGDPIGFSEKQIEGMATEILAAVFTAIEKGDTHGNVG